jgi:hypothetical protein
VTNACLLSLLLKRKLKGYGSGREENNPEENIQRRGSGNRGRSQHRGMKRPEQEASLSVVFVPVKLDQQRLLV